MTPVRLIISILLTILVFPALIMVPAGSFTWVEGWILIMPLDAKRFGWSPPYPL